MKAGISLVELAQKIEDNKAAKKDFVADTRELRLNPEGDKLAINGHAEVTPTDHCHAQIAERLQVPTRYYNRMRAEAPALLAENVNTWFNKKAERRMVRTLRTNARAFLSDRYMRIEHEDAAAVVLKVLGDFPGIQVESCEMTEQRLYIKAVYPKREGEIKVGDAVQMGLILRNSEIGLGRLSALPFCKRLVCLNGMVIDDAGLNVTHIGRRADASESVYEMLSDEAIQADDNAILLKLRDVTKYILSEEMMSRTLTKFRDATEQKLEGSPVKAIEVLGKRAGLSDDEQGGILRFLIEGGDISKWGLANSITRYAHEPVSYDRATEMEELGGKIINLPASEWRQLAKAA